MKQILLVDDDALLRRSLAFNLEQNGFKVRTAGSAEEALGSLRINLPDVILLDIGLPGMDGLEAVRQLRREHNIPVIFLTARRRELDEILGLELGGDDYITKPFNLDVVIAHIKSILRRAGAPDEITARVQPVKSGSLIIDPPTHTVQVNGKPVILTPREYDLLYYLALAEDRVVPVNELAARVWGAEYTGEVQVVYVHIRWLRKKIEDDPDHPQRLITIRGVGYRLVPYDANT